MGTALIIIITLALATDALSIVYCNMLASPHMSSSQAGFMPAAFIVTGVVCFLAGWYLAAFLHPFLHSQGDLFYFFGLIALGIIYVWTGLSRDLYADAEDMRGRLMFSTLLSQAARSALAYFVFGFVVAICGHAKLMPLLAIVLSLGLLGLAMLYFGHRFRKNFVAALRIIGGLVLIVCAFQNFLN